MFPDGHWADGFYPDGFWPEYGLVIVPVETIALKTILNLTYSLGTDLNLTIDTKTKYIDDYTLTTKLRN